MPKTLAQRYELIALNRVKPNPANVNQGDYGAIMESIDANGFFGAILANERTGHILIGNHRYKVAIDQGFDLIPCIWVNVTESQERRIMLADNRTARLGSDDTAALAALLTELAAEDQGLSGTGFDGDDLDDLLNELTKEPKGPDKDPGQEDTRPCVIVYFDNPSERDIYFRKAKDQGFEAVSAAAGEVKLKAARK